MTVIRLSSTDPVTPEMFLSEYEDERMRAVAQIKTWQADGKDGQVGRSIVLLDNHLQELREVDDFWMSDDHLDTLVDLIPILPVRLFRLLLTTLGPSKCAPRLLDKMHKHTKGMMEALSELERRCTNTA